MLADVNFCYLQQAAETQGKVSLAQIVQAEESPPSLDSSMCLPKWPQGTGIQMHIQRCLFLSGM